MPALVHVAVAIITNQNNQVLISLRNKKSHQGGLWEFPGGKLEKNETVFNALKREIKEELNISIYSAFAFKTIQFHYADKSVLLDVWKVESFSGEPEGAEGQKIKWQNIDELNASNFPEANRVIIQLLKLPEKYMITGSFESSDDFEYKLESSLKKGVSLVQLRSKNTTEKEYKTLIKIAKCLCEKHNATLLLNSGVEVFLDSTAGGLHLTSQMLHSIRHRPIGDNFILSVSCHTNAEIEKAQLLKADIILLSPVKETKSHPGVKGIGWKKFTEIVAGVKTPVYALGGMAEKDLPEAKKSGAQGVAAISSFWN